MRRSTEQSTSPVHDGQALILFAVSSLVLIMFLALAADTGFAMSERRGAQNAADAASLAVAAAMIARGQDAAEDVATIESYLAANGYEDADYDWGYTTDPDGVWVDVDVEVPRIFLGAFYDGDWSVGTSAEASVTSVEEPFAMIALGEDPSCHPSTGIRLSGSNDMNITGGSVGSNSCIRVDGGSGDYLVDGNVEARHGVNDGHDSIQVTDGHRKGSRGSIIEDPLRHWVEPNCPALADGQESDDPHYSGPGSGHILTPGRYTSFPNSRQLSLLPGIYCIEDRVTIGSNMTARSVDADYETTGNVGSGGGVLLFVTGNSGEIRFNGQGSLQVRALSYHNPNFAGCTNACDENAAIWISQSSCNDFDATGGSESFTRGVIYAPCSGVEIGGNPGTEVLEGMIIADTVRLHGNATVNLVANQDPIDAGREIYLTR